MNERGRPSTYKPEYAELARKFCMLGATNDDLATCFEVAGGTIDYWIKTQPDFAESVQRGRDLADVGVVEKLYSRAMGSASTPRSTCCTVARRRSSGRPFTIRPTYRPACSGCATGA